MEIPVIICGSGSAGLCAATFLSCAGIPASHIKIFERNTGPMERGQADGVQCRTVEVFESFGLSENLLRDAYHVLEVCFWADQPDDNAQKKLVRTGRTADTMPGLSHHPHVILNQARINGMFLGKMNQTSGLKVDYGFAVTSVGFHPRHDKDEYPCEVRVDRNGKEEIFRAKYVLVRPLLMF